MTSGALRVSQVVFRGSCPLESSSGRTNQLSERAVCCCKCCCKGPRLRVPERARSSATTYLAVAVRASILTASSMSVVITLIRRSDDPPHHGHSTTIPHHCRSLPTIRTYCGCGIAYWDVRPLCKTWRRPQRLFAPHAARAHRVVQQQHWRRLALSSGLGEAALVVHIYCRGKLRVLSVLLRHAEHSQSP